MFIIISLLRHIQTASTLLQLVITMTQALEISKGESLLKTFNSLLFGNESWHLFFVFSIISSLLMFAPFMIKSGIKDGHTDWIKYYVIIEFVSIYFDFVYHKLINKISTNICIKFKTSCYERYQRLTYTSREEFPSVDLKAKIQGATNSISMIFTWGISTVINLIISMIGCSYIFITSGTLYIGVFIVVMNVVSYMLYTKKLQADYTATQQITREEDNNIRCTVSLMLPMFSNGFKTVKDIMTIDEQLYRNQLLTSSKWAKITGFVTLVNKFGLIMFIYQSFDSAAEFFLVLSVFERFNQGIGSFMRFMNQYTGLENTFFSFVDAWDGLEEEDDVTKQDLPNPLIINSLNVPVKDGDLTTDNPVVIPGGNNILLTGKSGDGKTRLIKSLLGQIIGATMNGVSPREITDKIVTLPQNVKETIPTSKITVRQIFDNEKDDELIRRCFINAECADWLDNLGKQRKNKNKKTKHRESSLDGIIQPFYEVFNFIRSIRYSRLPTSSDDNDNDNDNDNNNQLLLSQIDEEPQIEGQPLTDVDTPLEDKSVFDIDINGRISGGEKMRMCMALTLYRLHIIMIMIGNYVAILDEPEQGSNPEIAYKIIDTFVKSNPDVTIIVISHLEKIGDKPYWDQKWTIKNNKLLVELRDTNG
jgi:energy-coupling factor transporter ATP-binding protein EcfA2